MLPISFSQICHRILIKKEISPNHKNKSAGLIPQTGVLKASTFFEMGITWPKLSAEMQKHVSI